MESEKPMQRIKNQFSYIIVLVLVVLLALVVIIGSYNYVRISNTVRQVDETSRFDGRLIEAKNLLSTIQLAENNVKTYGLTKKQEYLEAYYASIDHADSLIEALHQLDGYSDHQLPLDLNLMDSLIAEKFEILNAYLEIQNDYRVDKALDKVLVQIEKKEEPKPIEEESKPKFKPKSLIQRLFQKNKNDSTAESVELESIDQKVERVKRQEKKINQTKISQEFALILEDRTISDQIDAIVNEFESAEKSRIAGLSEEAAHEIRAINQQMTLFFVNAGLLVLLVIWLIFRYVRANNRFGSAQHKAKLQAEQLAETKERFLNNMSHEIRTPMNAISGFAKQLSKSQLNSEQEKQVNIIQKSSDYLLHIIDDVLAYNKLENNQEKLDNRGFNLKVLTSDLYQVLEPSAHSKGVVLKTDVHPDVPEVLIGDPYKLSQILINVIGNSIKFTSDGSVKLTVKREEGNDEHCRLQLKISDTGIGMTDEQLSRVFKEFEQAEVSTTRKFGGTGLGLSITQKLVQLLGGEMVVESTKGMGTTFTIYIPFGIGDERDVYVIREDEEQDIVLKDLNILVVDDEEYNRKLLAAILRNHKVQSTEVNNGREAVQEVKRNAYDVILMDSRMPVMDGIEATRILRGSKQKAIAEIPIIALSAAVSESDQELYKSVGMNGFLPKPFKESKLIEEIYRVTGHQLEQPGETTNEEGLLLNEELDFAHLKELSNGDKAFFEGMLETFVETLKSGLSNINSAAEEGDFESVEDHAHRIAAPCKHLAAKELYSKLKTLEKGIRLDEMESSEVISLLEEINIEAERVMDLVTERLQLK